MWNRYSDAIIFASVIGVQFILWRAYVSVRAKAFNEGFKRGRASVQYVRERA